MKYKIYVPTLGETIDDAYEIECKFADEKMVVINFCEYMYSNRDGWEWMGSDGGYTKIHVVDKTGKESIYSFDVDFQPSFSVYKKKT